ncbi:MAG: hypothetical protein JWR11_4319 [Mycobacterium sp.]|jgi:hypothetical protein|nr:hypothetical protein [Mycobacterium sp.]
MCAITIDPSRVLSSPQNQWSARTDTPKNNSARRNGHARFHLASIRDFQLSSLSVVASTDDNEARVQQSGSTHGSDHPSGGTR